MDAKANLAPFRGELTNPGGAGSSYPPGYVKSYDEGRPRH
jgi:hypothetical protein